MLESLTDSPICVEALRVYLIVPELIRLLDEEHDVSSLIDLLSNAILKLKKDKLKMLESLWSALPTPFFKMLVSLYQRVSRQYLLKTMDKCNDSNVEQLKVTLQILQRLYQVNSVSGFKIQEPNFYLPDVTLAFKLLLLSLDVFPCIFDMEGKFQMFHAGTDIALREMVPGMKNIMPVRRKHILYDTVCYLSMRVSDSFRSPLQVHFVGEEGIDQGGVCQEFFTIITKELCAPETRIFKHYEESRLVWFPEDEPKTDDTFQLAGVLCGLALYNWCVADFHFPLALYKKLLNIQPTLEDLHELSPTEGRCVQNMLYEVYDEVIEGLMLDFTKTSTKDGSVAELVPNGRNIPVTRHNRKEYVDAYVNYKFNTSVKKHFEDFAKGFKTGCQNYMWRMFLPVELMAVIHGNTKYDWEQLEKNAKYRGYDASNEVIKNFWTVFHELSEEMKKKFLAFLTGSDRVPVRGMEKFVFTIWNRGQENPDLYYPVANTCSRILDLSRYSNMEILKDKFLHALVFYEEFGLA